MKQSTITGRIRDLRVRSGLTQAEVSQKLNIQRATYCNYENELRNPPLEVLIALAELYGVSVDYIIRGADPVMVNPLNAKEKKLLTAYSQLTECDQDEVSDFVEFKKLYPRLT